MISKRLLVIICVTAGKQHDVARDIRAFLKERGCIFHLIRIKAPPEIYRVVQTIHFNDFTAVAIYGGDGTIAAGLKAFGRKQLPVIIMPGGTANVLAKYYGITPSIEGSLSPYLNNAYVTKYVGIATVNGEPLVLDIHMGFWTQAIKSTPRILKERIGEGAYAWTALKKTGHAKRHLYTFSINQKPPVTAHGYTFLIVNQGNHNVLGVPLFPHENAPGLVQLAIIKSVKPPLLVAWFIGRLFGKNINSIVEIHRAKQLTITCAPRSTLSDDSARKIELPIVIKAGEYSAKVLVPPLKPNNNKIRKLVHSGQLYKSRMLERFRILSHAMPVHRFSLVAPNLYLGGKYPARAYKLFREWGITGIVNMRTRHPMPIDGIEVLSLPTEDLSPPSMKSLQAGVDFIKKHISQGGSVYVHCRLGEGRGPSMAAAYLISEGYTLDEALAILRKYRPSANPNARQRKRLAEWQDTCNTLNATK